MSTPAPTSLSEPTQAKLTSFNENLEAQFEADRQKLEEGTKLHQQYLAMKSVTTDGLQEVRDRLPEIIRIFGEDNGFDRFLTEVEEVMEQFNTFRKEHGL